MMEGLGRVAQRAELLDITVRVYTARLTANAQRTAVVDLASIVLEARDLIAAVEYSIETDGLPGEEEEEKEEEEEEEEEDEEEWVGCTATTGCAMSTGHRGGCFPSISPRPNAIQYEFNTVEDLW